MEKNWGKSDFWYFAGGILLITIAAAIIFWPILLPNQTNTIPWGSDTLGHASRVDFEPGYRARRFSTNNCSQLVPGDSAIPLLSAPAIFHHSGNYC